MSLARQNTQVAQTEPDYQAWYLTSGRFVAFVVIAFCLVGVGYVVVSGDAGRQGSLVLGTLAVASLAYVLGVRPGVLEGIQGIDVRNPLRTTTVGWGSVTRVDVTDVLRIHAGAGVVRCFAIPRRRPKPPRTSSAVDYGFPATPFAKVGEAARGPAISRADAISAHLLAQVERRAPAKGSAGSSGSAAAAGSPERSAGLSTRFATDALAAVAAAVVLLGLAVLVS